MININNFVLKMKPRFLSAIAIMSVIPFTTVFSQDAGDLLKKMDNVLFAPKDKEGKVTIIVKDRNGEEKVREAIMYQKGNDRKLYRYTKPESQAGIATLSLPGDVMWLYMPAFEKPRRISMLAKSQSFNNTDFSLEDMANVPYSDRFTPELISSEGEYYILRLVPGAMKSNYSKIEATISKEFYYPVQLDYFDARGKKIKVAVYKQEKTGKYWTAAEIEMTDLEKAHSTRIIVAGMKFDQGLPDEMFTVEKMNPSPRKPASTSAAPAEVK